MKIEDLEKSAQEIEAELKALDEDDPKRAELEERLNDERAVPRKMRFDTGDGENELRDFVKKGQRPREYNLEELALGRMLLNARGEDLPDAMESQFQDLASKARKYTMTTEDSGTGAELVDTLMWDDLFKDIHAKTLVAGLFQRIQMDAGTMELPEMGDAVFYKPAGEGQAVTATDLTTAKRTLKAYTLKAQVDISDEANEDSVLNMLISIRETLRRNASEVIDEVVLNGDTTAGTENINQYGAEIDSDSRFLIGFDGLLHYPLVEVTGQKDDLGALAVADFETLEALLGKYSLNPARCAYIIDQWAYRKAKFLDDFTTMDKMGDKATLLTGQLGQIGGIPAVVSGQIAKSDSNGRVDGATPGNNTLGRMLLVNRDMWKVGVRRNIRIAVERNEAKTLSSIVCTMRIGLQCFGDRSDSKYCHTALGYNITI